MAATIDYFYTPVSPWSYLGHNRFLEIARAHGARVVHRTIDLGRIFPATGGLPLAKRAPERQAYRLVELKRWSAYLDVPLIPQPTAFPTPDLLPALAILRAAELDLDADRLAGALMRALWAEDRPIGQDAVVRAVLRETGLPEDLLERADIEALKATRDQHTDAALELGVFGAPTYVLDGELFWGQDRLDFLERALANRA